MKTGYDQFFKNARRAQAAPEKKVTAKASAPTPKASPPLKPTSRQLAEGLRGKVTARKKPKKSIPWKLVGGSFIGLAITMGGLANLEKVETYFKKIEISFLGRAEAETAPAKDAKDPKDLKESKDPQGASAPAAPEKKEAAASGAEKKEFSPDEINHFAKLNERRRELDAREAELGRMESELAAQKVEMEKRLRELEQTRKNISQVLEERVQADDKKVETLVQVYSTMKPQQAAKIFETMDEDLAVEILGRMKKKNAAEILNLVKAEKAQAFSEKYAGYKRK